MKPVQLRIAGLHSYLDEQTIDFADLCGLGVFGIFGPTGAGKSTVLDAMTLALYGRVERAPRGTEGTIHQAEKQLKVSFTFELGQNPRLCYRAERTYRRKADAAHCTKAKLVEIRGAQETVLEEGEKKVTERVEAILGLKDRDFTRAVVLPQGKFGEFLSLRGKDRRAMLERIFNLSDYGYQLIERVKGRAAGLAMRKLALEMEQQGLGDASNQALAACRIRLQEAQTLETRLEQERQQAEHAHAQLKDHWDKQTELERVEARERAWQVRLPLVAQWEAEWEAAERAAGVQEVLGEAAEAQAALGLAAMRARVAQEEFQDAEAACRTAENLYGTARSDRQQEEPGLITRQAALEQALKTEETLARLAGERDRLQSDIASLTDQVTGLELAIERGTRDHEALASAQAVAQARLNELRVSADERRQVSAAHQALLAYRGAVQLHAARHAEWSSKDEEVQEARRQTQQADHRLVRAQARAEVLQDELGRLQRAAPCADLFLADEASQLGTLRVLVEKVRQAEEAWDDALTSLGRKQQDLERLAQEATELERDAAREKSLAEGARLERQECARKVHELEKQDLAAHLAAALEKESPCPVCGALEHPRPAHAAGAVLESARAELREAEDNEKQAAFVAERTRDKMLQVRARREALGAGVLEAEQEAARRQNERDRARAGLPAEQRDWSPLELLGWLVRQETEHRGRSAALVAWRKDVAARTSDLEEVRAELGLAQQERTALDQRVRVAAEVLADLRQKVQEALDHTTGLRAALDQARGPLSPEAVLQAQHAIQERDQEAETLHHRLQDQGQRLTEHHKTFNCQQADLAARRIDLGRLGEKQAAVLGQVADLTGKLTAWTGGAPAATVLAEVQAGLTALQRAEAQAERAFHEAQATRTRRHHELAAASESLKGATAQSERSEHKRVLALAQANFTDVAQASAALRSADQRAQLRKEIDAFRQEEQALAGQRHNLELKMRHRRVTAEDWLECQARRAEAEASFQSALAARGAAAEALQDMERKHARWQELAAAQESLAPEARNLEILQGILRGNEFVEFLAAQQLRHIAWIASEQLGQLTRYRYALEVDSESGFVIRDDQGGGSKRPTSSLSGGETFLASLALALALSKQIQLGNRHPLEFFFLDEGFGSLDADILEVVITALERLNLQNMTVGIISHVPELRNRIPRRLLVEPAQPGGRGTRVRIEKT